MPTSIETFKKIMFDLDTGGGVSYEYSITNNSTDVSNTQLCFLNFDLVTNVQNQNVTLTIQHYSALNGTLENTQTFTLNYNDITLSRTIGLSTPYTLITINYTSFNGILTGYIEKLTIGETTSIGNIGQSATILNTVDISGQRVIADISGQRVDISGQYLNVFVQNNSTTNLDNMSGINLYQIRPKAYMYTLSGQNGTASTNMMLGGLSCSINFSTQDYGLANPRTWVAYIANVVGASQKTLTYDYVNGSGNLVTSSILVPVNSYTTLGTNIVSINKWKSSSSFTTNDTLYIIIGTSNSVSWSIGGANLQNNYNGMITIPNGYIGYVSSVAFYSATATNLILHKWDTSGVRVNTYTFWNITSLNTFSGFDGSIGGIFYAGESIAWSRMASSADSGLYSNVIIRSII